jgi:phosphate uptake regulator
MEGRKLQLAGKSTFLVSLPKRWVTTAGLKAGDTLFVDTETDGSVSVRAQSGDRQAVRRKIFHEQEADSREHLLRKLIGAYVSGFGLIEVRFAPEHGTFARKVAREFCHLVIGPEVIEEARNALVIQDLSDPTELSSEKCLRRMHLAVRAMLNDAILSLQTSDETLAREVELRSSDVNRLYWMVSKQYHLAIAAPPSSAARSPAASLHGHRLIAKLLQRIGEHTRRIANPFPGVARERSLDPKFTKELGEARDSAVAILDRAFHALVTHDVEEANRAIDSRTDHEKLIEALAHKIAPRRGENLLALGAIVDSLARIAVYATEIAEEAIDLAVLLDPGPE